MDRGEADRSHLQESLESWLMATEGPVKRAGCH